MNRLTSAQVDAFPSRGFLEDSACFGHDPSEVATVWLALTGATREADSIKRAYDRHARSYAEQQQRHELGFSV